MQTSSRVYEKNDTNRRKRIITAARREQNRVGQKAYRQRLKQARKKAVKKHINGGRRFRELRPHQALIDLSSGGPLASTHGQGCQQLPGPARTGSGALDATICLVAASLYPAETSNDPGLTLEQSTWNTPNCSRSVTDTLERDLPSPGPLSPDLPWSTWADLEVLLPQVCHNIAILPSQVAAAAVNDTSNNNTQDPLRKRTTLADPVINNIQFTPATAFMAALDNALILRLDVAKLRTPDCMSPFYRPVTPQDDPQSLLASVSHPWIPAHLQPTLAQTLYPHHPFLDLLPFPLMRANAITMWTLMPHVFDLFDFKNDIIFNGALVCWTSNSSSRQPWDMRSWEAAPWFLKKWRMLLDGECGGEIWKHSSWWWNMRGIPYNPAARAF